MYKPESVFENETYNIFLHFVMQTNNVIAAKKLDIVLLNKKKRTCHLVDFTILADYKVKMKKGNK